MGEDPYRLTQIEGESGSLNEKQAGSSQTEGK